MYTSITTPEKTRIDKWLWAVRIFKSRSLASEACDKGRIRIGDQPVKASRNIRAGETISIHKGAYTLQFKVLRLAEKRLAAKSVADFYEDVTPMEELEKRRQHALNASFYGIRGEGRPTKKDRRDLDRFSDW